MNIVYDYVNNLYGENVAADACEKLRVYRDFLLQQNKLFNLTAITDPQEINVKHFIDSFAAAPYIKGDVADIGTGAGFPGIPLKILLPDNNFTLIDSLNKRVDFLNQVISLLNLTSVTAIHCRAEDLPKSKKYDTVVSRAVAELRTLCEYSLPFVKKGGLFISYKSDKCEEEVKNSSDAIKILGGELQDVIKVPLAGSDIVRSLVLIKKTSDTPSIYPRSGNKPKKQPL